MITDSVKKEFKKTVGFNLKERETNYLIDNVLRKDDLFDRLGKVCFDQPIKINLLLAKAKQWLKMEKSETLLMLVGYLYYLKKNFKEAKNYFWQGIRLNPDNLDNWFDLTFTLRHLGDEKTSIGILFHYDFVIHYYKHLNFKKNFPDLKKMVKQIMVKIKDKQLIC